MGLNGNTVLESGDVFVGMVSGESFGYKRNLRVTVDVRMEELTRRESYETTDHRQVERPLSFALSVGIWSGSRMVSGGQCTEVLRELVKLAPGFTREDIQALADLHATSHLNDMQAACDHQVIPELPADVNALNRTSWLLDNVRPCPLTGYRYGHAWLLRTIPGLTTQRVRDLLHI